MFILHVCVYFHCGFCVFFLVVLHATSIPKVPASSSALTLSAGNTKAGLREVQSTRRKQTRVRPKSKNPTGMRRIKMVPERM